MLAEPETCWGLRLRSVFMLSFMSSDSSATSRMYEVDLLLNLYFALLQTDSPPEPDGRKHRAHSAEGLQRQRRYVVSEDCFLPPLFVPRTSLTVTCPHGTVCLTTKYLPGKEFTLLPGRQVFDGDGVTTTCRPRPISVVCDALN